MSTNYFEGFCDVENEGRVGQKGQKGEPLDPHLERYTKTIKQTNMSSIILEDF